MRQLLAGDDGRLGEVIALEQLEAELAADLYLRLVVHLFGQQPDFPGAQRGHRAMQRGGLHAHQVHLDDVGQFEQRLVPLLEGDEVVQRQGEALLLQFAAAADDFGRDVDGFEDFEDEFLARQQLDGVARQHARVEVDEAEIGAERRLQAEFREDMAEDGGRGGEVVGDLRAVLRAAAEQQLVGVELLLAVEDRLAADEDFLGGHSPVIGPAAGIFRRPAAGRAAPGAARGGNPPGCARAPRRRRPRSAAPAPAWCWRRASGRSRRRIPRAGRRG